MIISVDHGNKSIKTPNALFTSGLIVSEGLQGFKTDYICWNNKYYTLTEQRIAYLRDKTEDERFYVLTLFAIAKELERRKVPETLDPIDITRPYNIEVWSCFDVLGEYAHDSFNGLFHAGVIFLFHVGVLLKIEWMGDAPLHTYPLHG